MPADEDDGPERERDEWVGRSADRATRAEQRPRETGHDEERPEVAEQEMLQHVRREPAVERRGRRAQGERAAEDEACDPPSIPGRGLHRFTGSVRGSPGDNVTRRGTGCRGQRLVTLTAAALVLAGCGSKQDALAPESGPARGITSLWWTMLVGSAVALAIVALILLAAWIRRNRPGVPGVRDGDRAALGVVIGLGLVVPIAASFRRSSSSATSS